MEKSNPRNTNRITWTQGSYTAPEAANASAPEPAPAVRPAPVSVLVVAQRILAALQPFPDAYRAVLQALRTPPPRAAPFAVA